MSTQDLPPLPEGFTFVEEDSLPPLPEGFTMTEDQPTPEEPGAMAKFADMFTGSLRKTPEMEKVGGIKGMLAGTSVEGNTKKGAALAALVGVTNDENELAKILDAMVPELDVMYNVDAQGNPYPIMINRATGGVHMLNQPGIDTQDLLKGGLQTALFTMGGPAGSIPKAMAKDALIQTGIEAAQAAGGGDVDVGEIALAGGMAGASGVLENVAGAGYRALKGTPTEETAQMLDVAKQYDVPVMTSDILPAETPGAKGLQLAGEAVPVVGTGGQRVAQQQAREEAVERFTESFAPATYDEVIKNMTADRVKKAAAKTYQRITPVLDRAGDIEFANTDNAILDVMETFTKPGRKQNPKAIEILEDIQKTIAGPGQSFSTTKQNISTWHETVDALNKADRSQMPSQDKALLDQVLTAMRKDRDQFAKTLLSEGDFRKLKKADLAYGETANQLRKSRLKGLLDKGDLTPEVAKDMIYSQKASDVKRLFKNLNAKGRSNVRSVIIQDIVEKLSKQSGGVTPEKFVTELKRQSVPIGVFFRGQDRKMLKGFSNLIEHTSRASKVAGMYDSPTGQQLIPLILGGGAVMEPTAGAAAVSVGGLSRIYESPKVMQIAARMASIKPGTTAFEKASRELLDAMRAVGQATVDTQDLGFENE